MIYKLGTAAFAGLLTYTILRKRWIKRQVDVVLARLEAAAGRDIEEDAVVYKLTLDDADIPEDDVPWGWIMDMDGQGQPLNVPADLISEGIEVLNAETDEDKDAMREGQWSWHVDAMAIREMMTLAQQIPDLETAFFTWVANNSGIPDENA